MNFEKMFATPQSTAAQCVGFAAMLLAFFVYAFRDRRKILLSKLVTDLLWVAHYLLLGAYSGAVINGINAVREGVFYHKEKRWASHVGWPILFVCLNVASVAFSWQGWISLLPVIGSSFNVAALWSSHTGRLRLVAIPALLSWLVYSILVGSLWSTLVNAASLCSILFALLRTLFERNRVRRNV